MSPSPLLNRPVLWKRDRPLRSILKNARGASRLQHSSERVGKARQRMISLLRKPVLVSVGLLAFAWFGHASVPEVEFFAVAVAPPTTSGADTQRLSITQFIKGLPRRNVYLRAEREMVKDHAHMVEAGLTLGDKQELIAGMTGPGKLRVMIDPVPVAPEMSATLSGDGFQFPSGSPARQFVDSVRPTVWKWQVVPTKTGNLQLLLRVALVVTLPGVNMESEYQVKEQEVTVIVGVWGWVEWIGEQFLAVVKWVLVGLGALALPSVWKRLKTLFKFNKKKRSRPTQTRH